jgi:HemK-related putative methylase
VTLNPQPGVRCEPLRRRLVVGYLRLRDRLARDRMTVVNDRKLLSLRGVFAPDSFTTNLLARNVDRLRGKSVLELGCGAGALAVLSHGIAASYRCADISELAVHNTRLNLQLHHIDDVPVFVADLFNGLPDRADVILFNAPFFPGEASSEADRKFLGGSELLQRFLREAPTHLRPGGEIWLTHSDIADEPGFLRALDQAGFAWEVIDRDAIWIETFKLYRVTPGEESR